MGLRCCFRDGDKSTAKSSNNFLFILSDPTGRTWPRGIPKSVADCFRLPYHKKLQMLIQCRRHLDQAAAKKHYSSPSKRVGTLGDIPIITGSSYNTLTELIRPKSWLGFGLIWSDRYLWAVLVIDQECICRPSIIMNYFLAPVNMTAVEC